MAYYVANVRLVVDVESEAEAADAVAEMLRPMLRKYEPNSCFLDWSYDESHGNGLRKMGPKGVADTNARMDE
jgi:hypothetical protein